MAFDRSGPHDSGADSRRGPAAGIVVVVAMAALTMTPTAAAHDHVRPRAALFVGQSRQPGYVYESTWLRPDDPGLCLQTNSDNIFAFPRAIHQHRGRTATVRLRKTEMPTSVTLETWQSRDDQGMPEGTPHSPPFTLEPHVRKGQTRAWDILFTPHSATRHVFISLEVHWHDEDGCSSQPDSGSQYVTWLFHTKFPQARD